MNFVRKKLVKVNDVAVVARLLVDKALRLASNDNVTAVLVCFSA